MEDSTETCSPMVRSGMVCEESPPLALTPSWECGFSGVGNRERGSSAGFAKRDLRRDSQSGIRDRTKTRECTSHTTFHLEYRLDGDSGVGTAMVLHWVRASGWHLEVEPVYPSSGGGKILGKAGDMTRSLCFLDSDVDG